jgi:hypothetical protein
MIARGRNSGGDFQLYFAIEVFKQHIRALYDTSAPKDMPLVTTITTAFGSVHERRYTSAAAIAMALIEYLTNDDRCRLLLAYARHDARGMIKFTTKAHLEWHTIMGRLPCDICGSFFNGKKGLRVHMEIQHRVSYTDAQQKVMTIDKQLIVYTAPADEVLQWKKQAQEIKSKRERTVLENPGLEAARCGDVATLKGMVAEGWNAHDVRDVHGNNSLLWAAMGGHLVVCQYLHLDCGLAVDELQGKLGRNALHWAARNGHLQLCDWLIHEALMNVDSSTRDGTTPLHFAVYGQHKPVIEWLMYVERS